MMINRNPIILFAMTSVFYMPALQAKNIHPSHTPSSIKKVLLVVAMDTEAAPIIKTLHLKKSHHSFSDLPMQGYSGKYKQVDVFLIENGQDPMHHVQNVGTQAATLATYLGINYFHPDLILSVGTAGGIEKNGANTGDIFASEKIYFYDRRIALAGYKEYGMGAYPSANFKNITHKLNLKSGIVCSGDSFDENQTDTDIILKQGCAVREMEAAGVAWVSLLTKTPMLAIKGITDIVGSKTGLDDFQKNFSTVTLKLSNKIKSFLDDLA